MSGGDIAGMLTLLGFLTIIGLVIGGIAYAIHLSGTCDDGKPHEWQVWVDSTLGGIQYRYCLKCNLREHREVQTRGM